MKEGSKNFNLSANFRITTKFWYQFSTIKIFRQFEAIEERFLLKKIESRGKFKIPSYWLSRQGQNLLTNEIKCIIFFVLACVCVLYEIWKRVRTIVTVIQQVVTGTLVNVKTHNNIYYIIYINLLAGTENSWHLR